MVRQPLERDALAKRNRPYSKLGTDLIHFFVDWLDPAPTLSTLPATDIFQVFGFFLEVLSD